LSRPFPSRFGSSAPPPARINGKIRAREVRVIALDGSQLGVIPLQEAISRARAEGVDLVEVAATANPPVCRIVDYGKYKYEQAKREKDSKKHQHANRVKEIQLTASIDAHDFGVKLSHAIGFLCEDMKVKLSLRFRGREMAHKEFGTQVMGRFITELAPWGTAVETPKLAGRNLNGMVNPLPRAKRAKNPREGMPLEEEAPSVVEPDDDDHDELLDQSPPPGAATEAGEPPAAGFANSPFTQLDEKLGDPAP
jgi:translation initiation factor IF-3